MTQPYIEYMRLDDYLARFHPRNPKEHDVDAIITSILRFGFVENPTIDEGTSYVAAGHGRGEALESIRTTMQFSKDDLKHHNGLYQHDSGAILPQNIDMAQDDMWLLPIVRGISFKDEAHVNAYLIASNRLVQLGGWDNQTLAEVLQELSFDTEGLLEASGYDGDDLDLLLQDLGWNDEPIDPPEAQIDRAAELQEKWQVKRGDLFQIGKHRLLCGDSTSEDDVARLMGGEKAEICFTSPPYNVAAKSSLPNRNKYIGNSDNLSEDEYLSFLVNFIYLALQVSEYCFVNIQSVAGNKLALINLLYKLQSQYADTVVWDKQLSEPAMAPKVLNSQFEYIHVFSNYGNRAIGCKEFRGTVSNVLNLNSHKDKDFTDIHKATYPIDLAVFGIENFTNNNSIIYDPFAGSGTTAIACEQLNRQARMMEIEPKYCAVILERLSQMNLTPELIES